MADHATAGFGCRLATLRADGGRHHEPLPWRSSTSQSCAQNRKLNLDLQTGGRIGSTAVACLRRNHRRASAASALDCAYQRNYRTAARPSCKLLHSPDFGAGLASPAATSCTIAMHRSCDRVALTASDRQQSCVTPIRPMVGHACKSTQNRMPLQQRPR